MRPNRLLLAIALMLVLVACSSSSGDGADATTVDVTLEDMSITLSETVVSNGRVEFVTTNAGTTVHEIEIFAGATTELPVNRGVADTTGLDLLDEIEDIVPGSTVKLALTLEPGDYVILCNLPGHYEMGMVTKLTVTG